MTLYKTIRVPWTLLTVSLLTLCSMPNLADAAATASVTPTGNAYIDGNLSGSKWASLPQSFSFPASASYYGSTYAGGENTNNFKVFNAMQKAVIRIFNIKFPEVTETSTTHGVIRYAESDTPSTCWGYYPSTTEVGGDVWCNNTKLYYDKPVRGNYAYLTLLHETGHALGLKHPHETRGSFPIMPADKDSLEYTIMSYRSYIGAPLTGGYTSGSSSYPQTRMMYDLLALQTEYGADYTVQAGDTVYSWSPTTGQAFVNGVGGELPAGNKIFMTVWDGGGIDTYNFSNYATSTIVNLAPGGWTRVSSTQLATLGGGRLAIGNIANALLYKNNTASLIENVIGGSANDTMVGNDADNTFTGNGGNDTLDGGQGNNTATYSGASTSYLVTQNSDGSWRVSDQRSGSPDGTDTIRNIQVMRFSDKSVTVGTPIVVNHAPTALNDSYGVDMNASLSVAALAGVLANDSDQDANQLTAIRVSSPLHGTLSLNTNGSFSYVPEANYYGPDSFSYKANDGALDSNIATVTISVQQVVVADITVPVVSITSPASDSVISGAVSIAVSATDDVGVASVELVEDGVVLGIDTVAPYAWTWDTTVDANGPHTLLARAYDAAGNVAATPVRTVTVQNIISDTVAPTISITSPVNGTKIKGSGSVSIAASASDAGGIATIIIAADGKNLATCLNAASCSTSWQGKSITAGTHTIVVTAVDTAGNSASKSVTISK